MANASDIVSTAFNFGSLFSSGVDLRTGMYRIGIRVGLLQGAGGQIIDLTLGYDFLSEKNVGFGKGWSLNLANYDKVSRRLTLSNGASFRFNSVLSNGDVTDICQYLKPRNVKVNYNNGELAVTHKDGTQELFDRDGNLAFMVAPSGHTLTFSYGANSRLKSIGDQANKLFEITYSSGSVTFTGTNSKDKVVIFISGSSKINRVRLTDDTEITLVYKAINGLYVVEYVYHPTGAIEQLFYNDTGIKLPSGGPVSGLPAVSRHDTYGAKIERISKQYFYSSKNFLGFGLARYTSNVDNLFEVEADYTYTCTEKFGERELTQTYNKYHLLVEESLKDTSNWPGYVVQEISMEYYADTTREFAEQPEQYVFPKKQTTRYFSSAGGSRAEVIEYEYDNYGNEVSRIDAYGIKTQSTYYPACGEVGNAPSTPLDIPYLLKQQTITPSLRYTKSGETGLQKVLRYVSLVGVDGRTSFPVLSSEEEKTLVDGKILSSTQYEYLNDQQVYTHGLLLQKVSVEGSTTQTESYSYQVLDDTLVANCLSSIAGLPDAHSKTVSCLHSGAELEVEDSIGVRSIKAYDGMGRILKETLRAGTQYEIIRDYRYTVGSNSVLDIIVSDGTQERVEYDALGREAVSYATDSTGYLGMMQEKNYNSSGLVNAVTVYDNFGDHDIESKSTLEYDVWGEVCKAVTSSGVTKVVEQDKVSNAKTEYIQSASGRTTEPVTTYYNERGDVIQTKQAGFVTSYEYDGMGRCIKEIDLWGRVTRFQRDLMGRNTSESRDIGSGLTISRIYDTQNYGDQVTEIMVNNSRLGTRKYDPAGRLTAESKGVYSTRYGYNTHSQKPHFVTQPDNSHIRYTIDTVLDEIVKYETSDGEVGTFTYHSPTGRVIILENTINDNKIFSLTKDYYPNGALKSESQSGKTAFYTYSRQGLLLTMTDYFGAHETRDYDSHHRLVSVIIDNQSTVKIGYDEFDRVRQEVITSQGQPTLQHTYEYDSQNRLVQKSTLVDGVHYLSQKYEYYRDGNLSKKVLTDESYRITTESYVYDELGRLMTFEANGPLSPVYREKGPIRHQGFEFDPLGNITRVETCYVDNGIQQIDIADYGYDANGMLITIGHSQDQSKVTLSYDDNGNLTRDERGLHYQYNVLGQLRRIKDATQQTVTDYRYSATGVQLMQSIPGQQDIELFYGAEGLLNEQQGDGYSRLMSVNGRPLSRRVQLQGQCYVTSLVGDHKNSILAEIDNTKKRSLIYTPYGEDSEG